MVIFTQSKQMIILKGFILGIFSAIRSAILLVILMVVVFAWGVFTVREQIFPFEYLSKYLNNEVMVWGSDDSGSTQSRAKKKNELRAKDLLWAARLTRGGYILHFRHANRDKWANVHAFDVFEAKSGLNGSATSFSKAVCLSAQGTEEAHLIKQLFHLQGVKVSQVISSPSCRARQTAILAFGHVDLISNALLHRTAMVDAQREVFARELRAIIDRLEVVPGRNVVLSGHGDTLKHDGAVVIDEDLTDGIDTREETGFVVIEKKDGKTIAHHVFKDIKAYATAVVELPVQ